VSKSNERPNDPGTLNRDPLHRGFAVLGALVGMPGGEAGIRELAAALDLPPSSVHRTVRALEREQMVAATEDGRYRLGLMLASLAHEVESKNLLWRRAEVELEKLVGVFNETMMLGIYEPTRRQMMLVSHAESTQQIRYVPPIERRWLPIHSGSSGLAILAFLPDSDIELVIEDGLIAFTPHTLCTPEALWKEIRAIRKRGYAFTVGHRLDGAVGIAAPIFRNDGFPLGDIVATFPATRLNEHRQHVEAMAVDLMAAAARLGSE
jgi:IclR family transcriptional regulator, acetate operon repressor